MNLNDKKRVSLCEILDRVLNKGAVITGKVDISVAGIELVRLGLQLVLASSAKLMEPVQPQLPLDDKTDLEESPQ